MREMGGESRADRAEAVATSANQVGVIALCGVGLIHFIDLFDKWHETTYVAVLYLVLIAGILIASSLLLARKSRAGWALGGSLAAATLLCYVVSRTWGLPNADDDIGNWTEPLGSASMFVEGLLVFLSAAMLALGSRVCQENTEHVASANESLLPPPLPAPLAPMAR